MKPLLRHALAIVLLLVPASAFAQEGIGLEGLYVGGYIGGSFLSEQDVEADAIEAGAQSQTDTNIDYDLGYRFGAYVGYQVYSNIRLQLDVSYMTADGENTIEDSDEVLESEQEISILSGTVGAFIDLFELGFTTPYVGAGVGIAQVEVENDGLVDPLGDSKQTSLMAYGEAGAPIDVAPNFAVIPALRFSWYNTKEEVENLAVAVGVEEAEFASIGDGLTETQFLVHARYSF